MSECSREIQAHPSSDAMARREFLRALLIGGVGLPLIGSGLLSGCGGGGSVNPPAGALGQEVVATRATLTQVVDAIRVLQDSEDAEIDAWLGTLGSRVGRVWPLMVAAGQPELRANVDPNLAGVLTELDTLGEPLGYTGPAPSLSRTRLQSAWDRAHTIMGLEPTQIRPHAVSDHSMWGFLFLVLLLLPELSDADAAACAGDAAMRDTGGRAEEFYALFHPTGAVGCTPCLFSGVISRVSGLLMYLYLGMGAQAAGEPGMLFGRDWLTVLVLIAALLFLDFAWVGAVRVAPSVRP